MEKVQVGGGAVLGALHGEESIPVVMREALYRCDTGRGDPRPEFLQTRVQLPALLYRLIARLEPGKETAERIPSLRRRA